MKRIVAYVYVMFVCDFDPDHLQSKVIMIS